MFYSLSPAVLAVVLAMQVPGQAAAQAPVQPTAPVAAPNPFDSTPPPPRPTFLLRPSITLNDVGIDTNILGTAVDPQRDTIGHLRLRAEPSLELGAVSLNGLATLGLSYFRQHTEQRSVDTNDALRLDVRLSRLALYASDAYLRTRDVFSPELDVRLQRMENTAEAGANLRVTGKTQIGAGFRHARFDFAADLLSTADLRNSLTRSEDSLIASMRSDITPLTTFVVIGDVGRDRFDYSSFRDADGVRVMTGFEFQPTALVSGKAYVGYRARTSTGGNYPNAGALVASLDLGYNPWEPVRLGIKLERDLDHSFMATERYYLVTGLSGSITTRLGEVWEIGGTVGRQRLDYGAATLVDPSLAGLTALDTLPLEEQVNHFGSTVAYRIGRLAVIRFNADYLSRDSQMAGRTYDRLRLVSSITIGFD